MLVTRPDSRYEVAMTQVAVHERKPNAKLVFWLHLVVREHSLFLLVTLLSKKEAS
jgi:hypothetical protein